MSSQGSDRFKWDFLLGLTSAFGSAAATLSDARTGDLLLAVKDTVFESELLRLLLADWRSPNSPPDSLRRLCDALGAIALSAPIGARIRECCLSGGVRLGIHTDHAVLADAPWECALLPGQPEAALGLYPNLHLYRWFDHRAEVPTQTPLRRILIVVADPQSNAYPGLVNGAQEARSVANALNSPECRDIEVSELRFATKASLERCLRENPPDIVHFICHGDVKASGGVLVLESDRPHRESLLYGEELAELLRRFGTRAAVLSGCFTGGSAATVGAALVSSGLEAVVGMQMPIGDASAHLFSRAMYASLSEGTPLEMAVHQGRSAIAGSGPDWVAPTLMLSSAGSLSFSNLRASAQPGPTAQKHNIPLEERPFIGRASEREALTKLIERPSTRLITITGMGGMGKTRLAKQVALDTLDRFDDGVRLVECEAIGLEEELISGVAAALNLESSSVNEAELLESIQTKRLLLVFDCFERVTGFAGLFPKILRSAPGIKIIVTSRVLLGVKFEREFTLDPMSLKRRRAQMAEGLALFEDAATFTVPDFKLNRKNLKLAQSLVQDLEAVPLAIVLAAGRLRHMSLEELSERVQSQRLEVLKRRPTGPGDRHADLLRVVGDSLSLLFEEDRALVRSLSVFQGGFFQDDAVAVLEGGPEVMDGISLLRDHSLLMSQVVNARMRFRILDTIREFLGRVPDDEELSAIRGRHARHFAALAAQIRQAFDCGSYAAAREQLSLDIGNYRVAVQWAVAVREPELIRQFARSLARVYFETGASQEFELLATSAETIATEADLELLSELYGLQGELCRRANRPEMAIEIWQRKVRVCIQSGDLGQHADTLLEIARVALQTGEKQLAQTNLDEFAALRDRLPDPSLTATAMTLQAELELDRHSVAEALRVCHQLEEMMRPVAVDPSSLYVWQFLARLYRRAGTFEDSRRAAMRAVSGSLESSLLMAAGQAILELSRSCELLGELETATRLIAIAMLIPTDAWPKLREQVHQRQGEFQKEGHGESLALAAASIGKADWEALARDAVRSLGDPS